MNSRNRRIYRKNNERLIMAFERKYMRKIYNAIRVPFVNVARELQLRGVDSVRASLNRLIIDTSVGEVLRRLYVDVGLKYANKTYNEIEESAQEKEKAGQISFNEEWARQILDYFKMYLIDKAVVPITIQSKEMIMRVLDKGTAEGWTIERMAKELQTSELLMWRARLIVRTETAKAAHFGRRLGEKDSKFETQKEWIAAHDKRTRHGHRAVDGEVIDSQARFAVPLFKGKTRIGVEMMFGPGDPSASAGNVCNCRCTDSITAKRDENGRLIRKPSPNRRPAIVRPNDINRPSIITV